ncbi:MAG: hypothetical protein Q8S27_08505, partial [Hoeflea sp.]|nr:hypothetical protein [Hoeflea sp.]
MINLGAGLAKIAGILKMGAGLPAIAGVVLAAAVGTYVAAPQFFKAGGEVESQSAPALPAVDSSTSAPPADPVEAPATEIASAEPLEPSGADSWVVPSFDVLRVEPDGSTVIAGKAEPGTTLAIMNGDTVIATTEVGPSGDFAAVLDEPLAPGDYQLTLQITGKDGQMRGSEEVATVSIPKEPGGDLLAMVSKPGKASRIIVQPEAPATETPVEVASAGSGETGSEPAATPTAPETAAPETAAPDNAAPGTDAAAQSGTAKEASAGEAADPAQVEMPALPEASALLTTSAPEIAAATAAPETGTDG